MAKIIIYWQKQELFSQTKETKRKLTISYVKFSCTCPLSFLPKFYSPLFLKKKKKSDSIFCMCVWDFLYVHERDRAKCPGWPWTCYAVKVELNFWFSCLSTFYVLGWQPALHHHAQFVQWWWLMLGRNSTNWTISQPCSTFNKVKVQQTIISWKCTYYI